MSIKKARFSSYYPRGERVEQEVVVLAMYNVGTPGAGGTGHQVAGIAPYGIELQEVYAVSSGALGSHSANYVEFNYNEDGALVAQRSQDAAGNVTTAGLVELEIDDDTLVGREVAEGTVLSFEVDQVGAGMDVGNVTFVLAYTPLMGDIVGP